jgi:adenosylmethionine-8-amino-7-oxononanoate aminotransferase
MSLTDLAALDRAHVTHPHAVVGRAAEPLIWARGEGARLWDIDGNEYVDGTCGLWQCAVGHGRAELADAAAAQIRQLEFYASFWDYSNEPSIQLAARPADLSPPGLDRIFFTNGGSEGIETAIKIVRLAWHAQGQPDRDVIHSRKAAYHGVGSASLAATGIPPLKEGFDPLPQGFVHLSTPTSSTSTDELIAELERTIAERGADRIAAMIGEPVLGVGGMIPPPEGYWPRVQEVLRAHGILLVLDEIVTAYGRTGHWFAAERYGLQPNVLVTAKALTSGYIPMGAVLIHDDVVAMLEGSAFRHGFTYNGHPVGAAVALANLEHRAGGTAPAGGRDRHAPARRAEAGRAARRRGRGARRRRDARGRARERPRRRGRRSRRAKPWGNRPRHRPEDRAVSASRDRARPGRPHRRGARRRARAIGVVVL